MNILKKYIYVSNPFLFTGQYFDPEIKEYYLRARQYNPHIGLFTTQDPVFGKLQEPLSLHPYLYCLNDPVNRVDPRGELSLTEILSSQAIMNPIRGALTSFAGGMMRRTMSGQSFTSSLLGSLGEGLVFGAGGAWLGNASFLGVCRRTC